jgi:DNA-binding beta-propeller fold protein YncE
MRSSVRRSAGNRGFRALADGGVPLLLGAALAGVLAACAPAAASGAALGQAPQQRNSSCRGHALRHKSAKAYVTGQTALSVVSLATGKAVRLKPIHDDATAVVSPDGRTAYAATGDSIVPIDVATNAVGKPIRVPAGAGSVAITPDGRTLYAAGDGGITPVSLRTCTTGRVITIPSMEGGGPFAITPDGHTAYVGSVKPETPRDGLVTPVNLIADTAGKPIHVPSYPFSVFAIAIAADGRTVYATNTTSVIPVRLATGKAGKPITLPDGAYWIALAP